MSSYIIKLLFSFIYLTSGTLHELLVRKVINFYLLCKKTWLNSIIMRCEIGWVAIITRSWYHSCCLFYYDFFNLFRYFNLDLFNYKQYKCGLFSIFISSTHILNYWIKAHWKISLNYQLDVKIINCHFVSINSNKNNAVFILFSNDFKCVGNESFISV